MKYGSSVRREDRRLVSGTGRYSDDTVPADALFIAFLRSPYAHAEITGIDVAAARDVPGVVGIYTGADLRGAGWGNIPCLMKPPGIGGAMLNDTPRCPLAVDRVRFVGEAVVAVVAETEGAALDAIDGIMVDYADRPAVGDLATALAPDATLVWDFAAGNIALPFGAGDGAAVEQAFATAAKIVRVALPVTRLAPQTMEPRSAWGRHDAANDTWHLHAPSQGVNIMRAILAGIIGTEPGKVRVTSEDVGGGFGARTEVYPEYIALLFAARELGRPVRWRGTRSESILTDTHGRDVLMGGEMAVAADGTFLALRATADFALGAYNASFGAAPHRSFIASLGSVYRFAAIACAGRMVYTHTPPTGPYRGAGRPEAALLVETLVEQAARDLGRDAVELRRQNMVRRADIPFKTGLGTVYDSGDFPALLDRVLARADWDGFAARASASAARGALRGRGLACFVEVAGGMPEDAAHIGIADDGGVEIFTALQTNGQGHATVFPQIVADRLGLSAEDVNLRAGDTAITPPVFSGSFGSRSIFVGGSAMLQAADALVEAGKARAAEQLGVDVATVTYQGGRFVAQSGAVLLKELKGLRGEAKYTSTFTFPNGAHVAEVEIDRETGVVDLVAYTAVDDCGNVINEVLAHGQVQGGIVQGAGQALFERCVYDSDGQLLTGSFMDYAMPHADDMPNLEADFLPVPTPSNPLGAKGVGEAGTTGALAATMNAINNALVSAGRTPMDMPATPDRVWKVLNG